jgi:hypothetical protein
MSGYLGTKAVLLSTTSATVGGDSTVGGDLTVDTNTLYVDSTNNRVGVGTASPSNPFQVGTSDLIVDSSGNVGIGTSSPDVKFHVSGGNARIAGTEASGSFIDINASNTGSDGALLGVSYYGSGSYGPLKFTVGGSERMRIDSSGRVGIGTSSPATPLDVTKAGGGNFVATFQNTTSATPYGVHIKDAASGVSGYPLFQVTNSAGSETHFRVDSGTGNVFVGVTSSITAGSEGIELRGDLGYIKTGRNNTGSVGHFLFYNPNGNVGSITTSGSSTAFNTSSDHRLKENVTDVTDGITRVKQLEPKRFNFIADPDKTVDGFLAHEAQAIVPEAVTGTHNEVDDDGNAVMQGIDQSKLVPLLTAALKESIAKIEALEARVTALEGN